MKQGDHDALGHPQRPRQAQPRLVQQVPFMFISCSWSSDLQTINGRGNGCNRPARLLPLLVALEKPGRFTILDSEGIGQGREQGGG